MKKLRYLASVGLVGMAGGLLSAPLAANDGEETAEETVSLEAQGTFQGFTGITADIAAMPVDPDAMSAIISARSAAADTVDVSAQLASYVNSETFVGTVGGADLNPEIYARDDVGLEGIFDADNTQPSVVQLLQLNNATGQVFLNCTGTVINPRTILTAAHCVNSRATRSSEAYGLPETGAAFTQVIVSGNDTSGRFFNWLNTGAGYNEGGAALGTDVIIHASSNPGDGGLPFPFADIALIAVDAPITDVPSMPILLSPLTELTRVILTGYGQFGTAIGGRATGSNFLRRAGENMLGMAGSFADFDDVVFSAFAPNALDGSITQPYYFTDFDWPDRDIINPNVGRPFGCNFNGFGPECQFLGDVWANDWFDGDALPNEVSSAPGDSGSPLIVPDLYEFPVVAGVLSGGLSFFGQRQRYGDISFYNPLYNFFEFISENTAYKYVSAAEGDGVWSDSTRWTQDLDPGFFIDDGNSNLVNGLPSGSEDGIFVTGPKVGTVLGTDISGFPDIVSPFGPQPGDPNFGANTPNSSALLGPGSTGFVPQNTDGTPGQSFANPAQYFEVHLNRAGTTTVDLDVEIDKLVIDNDDAGFVLPTAWDFTSVIDVEQMSGSATINGTLTTPIYTLLTGDLSGTGTINTNVLLNVAGVMNAGGADAFGTLTIDGDFVNTAGIVVSEFMVDRRRNVISDLYSVTGEAILGGLLLVSTDDRRPRFGTEYTALTAGSIDGNFSEVVLLSNSVTLFADATVQGNDVVVEIKARSVRDLVGRGRSTSNLSSFGATVDTLRATNFAQFTGLFDVIDGAGFDTFLPTLNGLTPMNAFNQTMIANNFSQRFTGQLSQRTLALRGGNQAAAGFSSAGGAVAGIAQTGAQEPGKLGFFSTVSGSFLVNAEERNSGVNAFEESAFTQAGELTLGADMAVSDNFTVGVAMTSIRNAVGGNGAQPVADDTNLSGAVYAALQMGKAFADGYMGFSRQDFGVQRAAVDGLAMGFDNAWGNANGDQRFGGMRVGYAFDILPGVSAGPVASLDYVRSDLGGYNEIGAGQFGLTVLDRSFTSVGSKAGLMASLDTGVGKVGKLSAFGSVAYSRELADTQDIVTAAFIGAADLPFTIANALEPDWVSITGGADLSLGSRFRIGVSGHSDLGRGPLTNNQARMNLTWSF